MGQALGESKTRAASRLSVHVSDLIRHSPSSCPCHDLLSWQATLNGVGSFEELQTALRAAPWADLDIDPNMSKFDLAMKFEREGHSLEAIAK